MMAQPKAQDSWKKILFDVIFCLVILPACAGFIGFFVLRALEVSGLLSEYMKVNGEAVLLECTYAVCIGLFVYRFLVAPLTRK